MARVLLDGRAVRRACMIAGLIAGLAWPGCENEVGSSATERSDDPGGSARPPGTTGGDTPGAPDGKPRVSGGCVITGCNDQICSDRLVTTDCAPTAQDACFETATCERGDSGSCRWAPTTELHACLARTAGMSAPDGGPGSGMRGSGSGHASDGGAPPSGGGSGGGGADGDCRPTGCFGELCDGRDVEGGDCRWQDTYACYYTTTCERQPDGRCGWTPTEWLDACLGGIGGFGF